MAEEKTPQELYRRCKLKKFPQTFTFKGNNYIIEEKHKKYLKMPINLIFVPLDQTIIPLPLDAYANVVMIKSKKKQQMFSKMIGIVSQKEKVNRTLALSPKKE